MVEKGERAWYNRWAEGRASKVGKNMNDKVIKANSISEYIEEVASFNPKEKNGLDINYIKIFRGVSDEKYDYIPSIFRPIDTDITFLMYEDTIYQSAKLKMPDLFIHDKYPVQTLIKLQHYGLPTRLLDFSYNALVALYFACQNKSNNTNGKVIICYEYTSSLHNCYSAYVNAIADMNIVNANGGLGEETYYKFLSKRNYWVINEDIHDYDPMFMLSEPIFFEPELNSERLKRQQGLFLIFPNLFEEQFEEQSIVENKLAVWKPEQYKEIIIPCEKKEKIQNDLFDLGITKSFLFPEPENICTDIMNNIIKRDYRLFLF